MLNANQLAQQYTTALACPITNAANAGATLLTTANTAQTPISLSTLQQHHSHATSPYIFLSTSDEVCANTGGGTDLTSGVITGKTPSAFYFYNNNSAPTIYPTEFLRL
jgi:hypothetical protein